MSFKYFAVGLVVVIVGAHWFIAAAFQRPASMSCRCNPKRVQASLPVPAKTRTFYGTGCKKVKKQPVGPLIIFKSALVHKLIRIYTWLMQKLAPTDWNFVIRRQGQFLCDNISELRGSAKRGWKWKAR